MRTSVAGMLAVVMLAGTGAVARQQDPDMDRLVAAYQSAWNTADVKALAALYSPDAMRMQADAAPLAGRAAIEQFFSQQFAGPWKGTKLSLKAGRTQTVTADVRMQEGTFEVTGGAGGPSRGRYLNTVVRQGGEWTLAAVAPVPETPPAK